MLHSIGGYFCCTLPRFEVPLWSEILSDFHIIEEKEMRTPFETPSMNGEIYCLGEFLVIEAQSKTSESEFRMMLETEMTDIIPKILNREYEKSIETFGEPDVTPFPWQIYSAEPKENK